MELQITILQWQIYSNCNPNFRIIYVKTFNLSELERYHRQLQLSTGYKHPTEINERHSSITYVFF